MDNVKLFHFIVVTLSVWINRHQQAIIDYFIEANRIFKQYLQVVDFDRPTTIGDTWPQKQKRFGDPCLAKPLT